LLGSPLIGGPQHVQCKRTDQKGIQGFIARHDGYVPRFGFLHERELKLSSNGNVLAGRDRFQRPGNAAIRNNGRDFVTVRFHVHPDVNLLQDEHDRLVLAADQADTWVFTAAEVVPEVEESIYFAGLGGPRRSRQIVLAFKASEIAEVHWQLTRTSIAGHPENN
ncbi:heparinase, partial [Mesorhizobium sp. M7A.T.Ca.TU.009.01.1.2]